MGRYSSHFQGFAPGSQFGVDQDNLGYVRGLNPGTVKDIEKDARFVQDVMTYYEERDGVSFQSAEEALEYYWNDRSWNNLNTMGIGKEWAQSKGMEEPQKARLSRLQRVYEMYPNFYEEGGKGMEGLWRNTKSVLLDPVNLIGFGSGAVAGRGVAFGARMAGQSAKEATRAGIKAGAKRGAVVEAGINAPIALGADVALQGRDIELGIQDEFDPLRAGISTVAGAGLGGAMGAGFGAMGAGLPYKFWKPKSERSATRRGIAEADVKLADRAAAEEAEAAARAAEGRADLDEVDPERITLEEAETLLDNFEQLHLAHLADELDVGLDEAVDVVTKVQRGELANETARAAARIKVIKEWPKHRDAQEAQAAALEAKADERAVSARQRIIEQDEAHQSLAMALKRGDLEEAERVVRGTSGGPDEVELGGVPGFDEAPPAGGAAPSRGAAGAETPTGGPERGVETPEGPTERPEGGETESPVADDTGAPAPRGPEGDETGAKASDSGSEDLPDPTSKPAEAPLEEQLAAAKTQLDDLAVQNRKDYDRANYLRKKADAGTLTEPEAAEAGALTDSLDARKQALKDARANVKHISEQVKAKTDEIVTGAEPDHVKVETDEPPPVKTDDDAGGLPTDKGEAAVDTVVPPKVNAAQVVGADDAAAPPTFEDLVTELGGLTEKDIVLRLSDPDDGIGLSAKEVRAGLREAGQGEHGLGLTKSHKKVAKKAWIAKQLKIYQAKQALIDQVQETIEQGNERVVFMPEVFRELLKARVGDDNHLRIHIANEYDNFLDKNVPLFAANKLAEYDPADAGRLIEDIRKEFGSEIADRLVGDVQAARSGEFDISKFDLTEAQQKIILTWQKKVVEELVKSGKPRPMALSLARLASISKIEAIKNKTMDAPDGGVRLRQEPGGHEGRTHIPAYQKIRARVNHLQRKMAEGDDLTATQSQMEGMNEAQELAVLLEQKAKIEAGELSLRPVAGQIQSILRPGRGKSATQYTYMYALYPRLAERDESGARIFDAAESARREIEDAAIASTTLRKAGTDEKTGLNITQKEQVAREVETARGKADRQISALEAKLAGLYDARPKEGKAAPEIEGAIKAKQAEIKKAREAKDKEKVAALTEEMKELRAARKPAKKDDQIEAEIKTTKDEIRAIDKAANDAEIGRLEALLEQRQLGEPTKGRPVTDIEKELAALKETAKTDYFKRKKAARKERKVERDFFKSREWQQLQKLWGDRFQHIKQSRIDATNAKQRKIVTKLREEFGDRFEVVYAKAKIAFLARAEDHIRWRKARGQDTKPLAEYERMWHEAWGDNTLDPVDERVSHTEVAKEVVDNSHREQAQLSQEGQSIAAAAAEFIRTGDKAKLQAAIEKARTSTSPPTDTKPRGKRTPRVIVHQGIEIDVENDLAYAPIRGTDDTINSTAVFFHAGGPEVATITKWKNGYLIESTDGDNVLFVKDRGKVKDRIPEVISEQIKAAAKAGRLALSRDVDETLSYPEPNWHETNTHRGADLEDASAPEPNSADIDSPDILATELRAISVPKGKQVAIQLLSGKFSGNVRRASDRQLDAGRTVGDVLGKATSQEYVIGYSDAGRISKGKIQSTFVPLDPGANFIKSEDVLSSMGSSTPKLSNHATGAAKSLKARLPVRVHELDQIPIKIEDMAALPSFRRLDPAQFDKFETAADIHNWVMDMENTTWKMFGDDNASQLFATHIAKIQAGYEALAHYAPDGIKYPNASRRQAMRAVADLFNGEDITELSFITDALRRISGREGRKLPHLNQGETETPFFRQPRGQKGGNQITLTESAHVGTPKSVDLLHELGHWGYLNILTPEERLQFWNAMEKYVAKNGPDFTSLAKRLPGADPAAELSSPAEFFANQFAQFYVGSTSGLHWAEMKGIWSRMAETLNHIIDKYVLGINNDYVDPELRPLFERIAPYLDADGSGIQPNRFDEVYRAYAWRFRRMSEGKQQASPDTNQVHVELTAKLLYDSEEFRMAIESSIDSANPMRMEQALHNGAARFKGLINSLKFLDHERRYATMRGGELTPVRTDSRGPTWAVRDAVQSWRTYAMNYKAKQAEGRDSEIQDLIRQQAADMAAEGNVNTEFANQLESASLSVDDQHLMMMRQHANWMINGVDDLQNYAMKVFGRNFARNAGGTSLDILPTGQLKPRVYNPKQQRFKGKHQRELSKSIRKNEEELINAIEQADKAVRLSDYIDLPSMDEMPGAATSTRSLKDMEVTEILAELRGGNRRTKRYRELEAELFSRKSTGGEGGRRTYISAVGPVKNGSALNTFRIMKTGALRKKFRDAVDAGEDVHDMIIAFAMKREESMTPQSSVVGRALHTEINQSGGIPQFAGIPGDAPLAIQEALSKITHRDKLVERNARLMAYRMLNLMGRTGTDMLNDAGFMSVADVYRLAGQRVPDKATGAFTTVAQSQGAAFNKVRKSLRQYAIGLKEGTGDPFDLMHEIGHMVSVATMSDDEVKALRMAFNEAMTREEAVAMHVRQNWKGEFDPDRMADEWFAENFTRYFGNRVTKQDIFKYRAGQTDEPLQLKSQLDQLIDRVVEFVTYVVNGMIGRNDIHQQFRRIRFHGNIFGSARRSTPTSRAVNSTMAPAHVSPNLARDYVSETIKGYDPKRAELARQFIGLEAPVDLKHHVWYHATPDGLRFREDGVTHPTFEAAAPDSRYGPGVYILQDKDAGHWFSRVSSPDEMRRTVDSATKAGVGRGRAYELIDLITKARERIDQVQADIRGVKWRESTRSDAEDLMVEGVVDPTSDMPAHRLAQLQEELIVEVANEEILWREFGKATGSNRAPKVMPVYARAMDTFDFSMDTEYGVLAPGSNDIEWFLTSLQRSGMIEPEAVAEMSQMGTFTGAELYEHLVHKAMLEKGPFRQSAHAKQALADHLTEMGYDSIKVSRPWGEHEVTEAMVMLNPGHLKHIDASSFNQDVNLVYNSQVGRTLKLSGSLANGALYGDEVLSPANYAAHSTDMQRLGMPAALHRPFRRMSRGERLEEEDIVAFQKHGGAFTFLAEQSVRLRKMGAQWYSDLMKPENGPGFYEQQAADMAGSIHMIIEKANALPDNKNRLKRWWDRNAGLAFKDIPQPESHLRIIKAIRRGDVAIAKLNPEEKEIAMDLVAAFQRELDEMIDLGIQVGNVEMKLKGGHYVPQIWDVEHIRDDPSGFMMAMKRYFLDESRRNPEMAAISPQEATDKARSIFNRMMVNDGLLEGDSILKQNITNPFYKRVITLTPDDYKNNPALEGFLVDDLVGLTSKYFDKTSRKKILTENLGVGGHAYSDYMNVAERGVGGAVETLITPKKIVFHRTDYYVDMEIENQVIPALRSEDDARTVVQKLMDILGPDVVLRRKHKQTALNYLINSVPLASRNEHWLRRADAIVNGLVDFGYSGAALSDSEVGFINKTMNILNRRPPDGGHGTGLGYHYSRLLRSFNSVTLLPYTTLTSIPDIVLPLIRSGRLNAWRKGWTQYMADPEYRRAARRIGTSVENLLHDRMVHMAGEGSQRFANSFFNFTLLTPWTNIQREIATLVGFEAFRAEQANAISQLARGNTTSLKYKRAVRFLERYGLTGDGAKMDYLAESAPRLDDIRLLAEDPNIRYGLHRFVNETIFTPNPNDIPMLAQNPFGALVWQLKSFPMMMARMSKYVLKEATVGKNPMPLIYMLAVGGAFGVGANASKDLAMWRGGEDERSPWIRSRSAENIAKKMGWEPEWDGPVDTFFGHYIEGFLAMGGLGLFAELLWNTAEQLDNGEYGKNRVMSFIGGPTAGLPFQAFDVMAGAYATITPGDTSGKQRQATRTVAGRIPFFGQNRNFREGAADLAGAKRGSRGKARARFGAGFGSSGFKSSGFD